MRHEEKNRFGGIRCSDRCSLLEDEGRYAIQIKILIAESQIDKNSRRKQIRTNALLLIVRRVRSTRLISISKILLD